MLLLYTDYHLDTILGLVKGGRIGGVWGGPSVLMWNRSHYLSGVAAAAL